MRRELAVLSLLLLGCGGQGDGATRRTASRARPLVCTTTGAVHCAAVRIAGDAAEVVPVVPAGEGPLHWSPDAAAIARMQDADLILLNGAGAEAWVGHVALPISRIVETAHGLRDRYIRVEGAVTHSHGGGETHTHSGVDPYTWVDPKNAILQARAVLKALRGVLPGAADVLQKNFDALAADLEGLHRDLAATGVPDGEVLVASHASYRYLARRHGWTLLNVDLDPTRPLGDAEVAAVRSALEGRRARVILWERGPRAEVAQRLQDELGLASVVFDPGTAIDDAGDYLALMRANVGRLRAALP